AHLIALERAPAIGFGRYIISATTPFLPEDMCDLRVNAPLVAKRRVPGYEVEYERRGWKMFPALIVYTSTERHEGIWAGILATILTMCSPGYDLTKSFVAHYRLLWVPRVIIQSVSKNGWLGDS